MHLDHKEDLKEVGVDDINKSLDLLEALIFEQYDKIDNFVEKIENFKLEKIKYSEDLN
jgi:hypothetical protein